MNIILYILDDLRPDFLGCYGFLKDTSPNIDAFTEDAVLYEKAYSTSNGTKAAATSIFTSQYPRLLSMLYESNTLPEYDYTLPKVLKSNEFGCYGISANLFFSPNFGFTSFDEFFNLQTDKELIERRKSVGAKSLDMMPSEYINEKLFPLFKKEGNKFFFLWAVDPHGPFYVREGDESYFGNSNDDFIKIGEVNSNNAEKVKSLYCDMIRHNDSNFGKVISFLKEKGIYDDSMIIVAGDHGEAFGEHEWILNKRMFGHSDFVFEEVIRIPLIIKYPKNEFSGQRVNLPVQLIDIFPTILGAIGVGKENLEGVDICPSRISIDDNRLIFTEGHVLPISSHSIGIKVGDYKLIKTETPLYIGLKAKRMIRNILEKLQIPSIQLYNLKEDPLERENLASKEKDKVKILLRKYNQLFNEKEIISRNKEKVEEEVKKRLKNLGYFNE